MGTHTWCIRLRHPVQTWHSSCQCRCPQQTIPLPDTPTRENTPGEITLLLNMLQSLPVLAKDVRSWTTRDPTLSKVRTMLSSGWKDCTDPALKAFTQRRDELSLDDGCILWGSRVIVPRQGRETVLEELHQLGHPGITRMKALACSFVWWPGMDKELELKVKQCEPCQKNQHLPAMAPIQPWEFPKKHMVKNTHRLRWPCRWTYVSGSSRCLLQVAGRPNRRASKL